MITTVINEEVNEIVGTTATTTGTQAATSQEIAGNISQASQRIPEVNDNVGQSSIVAGSISGDITGVNLPVQNRTNSTGQVNMNA